MIGSLLKGIKDWYAPPAYRPRLPPDEVSRQYRGYRWRAMESTFIGYASFYLVRNNLGIVAKDVESTLLYSKSMIGDILAITAISYGIAKFLMGSLSDRSDPRKFMATGLLLSAILNFAFGGTESYYVHLVLWSMNGFVQGMGWPPCGRVMGHWFSESERGYTFSIWNTSHNLGGAIAGVLAAEAVSRFGGWQYAFYVPGAIAAVGAIYLFVRLRDTPQSVGLPPIEEYRNDYPANQSPDDLERELSTRELFVDKVLANKFVWLLAFANFFAYITRYSMLDWGPTYLREIKGADISQAAWAISGLELAGIPSTIFLGWISDKLGGRRGMVAALSMIPIVVAFAAIPFVPPGYLWVDVCLLGVVGFFIYPVINLIVIAALDVVSKKAIGTAAGFIGLFGYIGRTVQAKGFGWGVDTYTESYSKLTAWNGVLAVIVVSGIISAVLLALTWNVRTRE